MSNVKVGMTGHAPSVLVQPVKNSEQEKYDEVWKHAAYRAHAPGEHLVDEFMLRCRPLPGDTILDFGCGTGRAAIRLAKANPHFNVVGLDFAAGSLDAEVADGVAQGTMKFHVADLTRPITYAGRLGMCTDVMEHVPEPDVQNTLKNILNAAQVVFFQICTAPDHMGALIGETLHVTVKPHAWWKAQLEALECTFFYEDERGVESIFVVSNWINVRKLIERGGINIPEEELRDHIRQNVAADYTQVTPHELQATEIMVVAGGPSLAAYADEIKAKRLDGMPLVTVNGAYNWALAHGLSPSAQIMLDGREFMSRMLQPIVPGCKYLLASQMHPSVLRMVPADQLWMFHAAISPKTAEFFDSLYEGKPWFPVPGGSTVMLRTFPLLRILGFRRFHVYGFDSCMQDDAHHAYAQPENDSEPVMNIQIGTKTFFCQPWMASQAQEFIDLVRMYGDEFEMIVYGDGLIANILEHGASME
jgi:SAM-dependent methyltransferase